MGDLDEAEFRDYVQARLLQFRRRAYALCGDWHEAEDLVQYALEKLYLVWPRLRRSGYEGVDAYVMKIIFRKFLDHRKSAWWRRTDRSGAVPERLGQDGHHHDDREPLLAVLQRLPRDQRAVLVLRYWEDLSAETTAHLLGFSVSKVKTLASRGCARMRVLLAEEGVKE